MEEKVWKRPDTGEVPGEIEFVRPKKLAEDEFEGVVLEGVFLEAIPNKYNEQRSDYKFQKEDGTIVIVNGAGNLGYRMKEVSPGDFCQVSYEGMKAITTGTYKGKSAHSFTVLIA